MDQHLLSTQALELESCLLLYRSVHQHIALFEQLYPVCLQQLVDSTRELLVPVPKGLLHLVVREPLLMGQQHPQELVGEHAQRHRPRLDQRFESP
eukprot:CAMPEP_0173178892 /NCGR_PEP_ID=MMETSP1141-20130122/5798_1 /TAXON_ID=483371 /ORGANISM="non described non described, Strain CCMP2298" /LENGTH=94 /DNA_ID=CAMNT_0014101453 /DNA_START=647 /DNA_END=931 /DNA_ORIENTATION=-